MLKCDGFGWNNSYYAAVFWIRVDNTGMSSLLLSSTNSLFCFSPRPENKELRGDTAGTADPNRPKGSPVPYGIVLSIQN